MNFLLNLKNRRTPALLALALLTANTNAMITKLSPLVILDDTTTKPSPLAMLDDTTTKPSPLAMLDDTSDYYKIGCNAEKDKEAAKYFQHSADQGDPRGQYALGRCYEDGIGGMPQDMLLAAFYIGLAASQGHHSAQEWLTNWNEKHEQKLEVSAPSIEQKQEVVAPTVEQTAPDDDEKQESTNSDDPENTFQQGCRYLFGNGCEQNAASAVTCFTTAAQKGHCGAQYNLGCCYLCGNGVKPDNKQAWDWFWLAAQQGDPMAHFNLGVISEIYHDLKNAILWYAFPAYYGNQEAQQRLRQLHRVKFRMDRQIYAQQWYTRNVGYQQSKPQRPFIGHFIP